MWKKFPSFSKRKQVASTTDVATAEPIELELTVLQNSTPVPEELKGRLHWPPNQLQQQQLCQKSLSNAQAEHDASANGGSDASATGSTADEAACMDGSCTAPQSEAALQPDDPWAAEQVVNGDPPAPATPLRGASLPMPLWPSDEDQQQQSEQHFDQQQDQQLDGQQQEQAQQQDGQLWLDGTPDGRLAISVVLAQLAGEPHLQQEHLRGLATCEAFLQQCCDAVTICKLILSYFPEALDERALILPSAQLSGSCALTARQQLENAQLCVSSAQGLGIRVHHGAAAAIVAGDAAVVSELLLAVAVAGEQAVAGAQASAPLRRLRSQQLVAGLSGRGEGQESGWSVELLVAWAREVSKKSPAADLQQQQQQQQQQQLETHTAAQATAGGQAADAGSRTAAAEAAVAHSNGSSSCGTTSSSLSPMEWLALLAALLPERSAELQPLASAAPHEQAAAVLQELIISGAGLALVTPGDLQSGHGVATQLLLLRLLRATTSTWLPDWQHEASTGPSHSAAKQRCSSTYDAAGGDAAASAMPHAAQNVHSAPSSSSQREGSSNGPGDQPGSRRSSDDGASAYDDFDDDNDPSISREERVLRTWINSLGVTTHCHSLFGPEIRAGWLLLEVVEALNPGSVNMALANRPPFRRAVAELKSAEIARWWWRRRRSGWGCSFGRDIVHGVRKAILSFVFQLCRYHTLQLLDSISLNHVSHSRQSSCDASASIDATAAPGIATPPAPNEAAAACGTATPTTSAPSTPRRSSADASSANASTSWAHATAACSTSSGDASAEVGDAAVVTGFGSSIGTGQRTISFRSSSCKQRQQLRIRESDILDWANDKLKHHRQAHEQQRQGQQQQEEEQQMHSQPQEQQQQQLQREAVAIRSFRDPCLARTALLRLLQAMRPDAVDDSYVTPGDTLQQREANAKYALSVARRLGASIYLVWEDIVELQPRMLLVLLASLMWLDQGRRRSSCNG